MQTSEWPRLADRLLRAPETNLTLFAFLMNFVYEVAQTPYYSTPERQDPQSFVLMLFHCSGGDALISLACSFAVAAFVRDRHWLLNLTAGRVAAFTLLGWLITVVTETYRFQVLRQYQVLVFAVPLLGISWFALLQWAILPPLVLLFARRHLQGYGGQGEP